MRQVLQNMANGETDLVEAPAPSVKYRHVLIETSKSLISAGTERSLVDFGKGSFISKARQQPEKVRMVLDKAKTEGVLATYDAVKSKLNTPLPLGYSNVGIVKSVHSDSTKFSVGDRVLSNGPHSEVVCVPQNLCAKIPDNVSDEEAVFTVVGSIGLQGVRLISPSLGESVVVIGAGLIGLITVQLLVANGCRVMAIDFDDKKLELARQFGASTCNPSKGEDPVNVATQFSSGNGVDGVIITASTKSNDPVSQAARMSRKRGRIVLVGVTGLELNRSEFYEKELSFQVSCSYGPGRYDEEYELKGNDYPLGFVRWTEQRNFEAVLQLMSSSRLNVKPLITHRFALEDAKNAYEILSSDHSTLGVVLDYERNSKDRFISNVLLKDDYTPLAGKPSVGFVGAGNYASRVLIPAFKNAGANLHTISTAGGVNGVIHGQKAGFAYATSDTESLITNPVINTVVIATQHNTHAKFVIDSLTAGKHTFVEKPLALNQEELTSINSVIEHGTHKPLLMVGFNRRFAPHIKKMKSLLSSKSSPKTMILTMNAGSIPADHWTQDPQVGGGRIIGEACHYIDLARFLAGSAISTVNAACIGNSSSNEITDDKATITITFEDGSLATIHYFANGASSFPKERIEVFSEGSILQLDNFRKLKGFNWDGFTKMNLWRQDKGQLACASAFLNAVQGKCDSPIPKHELFEVARATIEAAEQLRHQN